MTLTSPAERLRTLPAKERETFLASLTEADCADLLFDWRGFLARPNQIAPAGDWDIWLLLAGRGFGKSRTGAEWIREQEAAGARRFAFVAETAADARDILVEGKSGILSIYPDDQRPIYEPSKRRVTWPSGAIATLYNAREPDQLRGPEHDCAWSDEIAKWRYARETWDQLQMGLRIGTHPQQVVTTTPRPIEIVRSIVAGKEGRVVVTRGRTLDNSANLAPAFLKKIQNRYAGTRLGRQELEAEILDDLPGALWLRSVFDDHRASDHPDLVRIVVAVDPSGTAGSDDDGDSIGIVVAGKGVDGRAYVLADYSCKLSPDGWGRRAVQAYHRYNADRMIAERNYGGAMVEHVIRTVDPLVSYKEVTASRGKVVRAEPVAALYEQGRVSHVGSFPELEDQCCQTGPEGYIGEGSPDRMDALVWALTELLVDGNTYTLANL